MMGTFSQQFFLHWISCYSETNKYILKWVYLSQKTLKCHLDILVALFYERCPWHWSYLHILSFIIYKDIRKISQRMQWPPTPVLLPGKSHGRRSLVGCSPWGRWGSDVTEGQTWLNDFTFTFHFHALEKETATHSSFLAWRIPGTGEPGGLPSMGSHRVGHDWSDLAAAAACVPVYTSVHIHLNWQHTCTSVQFGEFS